MARQAGKKESARQSGQADESGREEGRLGSEEEVIPEEGLTPLPLPGLSLPGIGRPLERKWVPSQHLAESRRFIAYWLLTILSGILALAWVAILTGLANFQDIQALMTIVFAPVIGLVGAATGFYFGERAAERTEQEKPPAGE